VKYFCVIYTYTTALRTPKGRVKVGSARRQATNKDDVAMQRISEQSTAISSDDPAIILEVFDVSDICETGNESTSLSNLRSLEKSFIHKNMKAKEMWYAGDQDIEVKDSSEWFFGTSVQAVVDEVKSQLNQKRFGIFRPNSYPMRDEQKQCHDKAVDHFLSGGDKFLMNAKMRFGKTFTTYQIIKSLKVKKVIVLTYKPAVDASWQEDLETHTDFEDWNYYSAKNFDKSNPIQFLNTGLVEILFTSFQDFNDFEKKKWDIAKNYDYDLVVIDEMHYGSATERAQRSLAKLKFDKILYVSGTPLKALMSGEFKDNEIYTWGYADEQNKRKQEQLNNWQTEIYRWLPVMKFHTFEVNEEAKKQVSLYSEEEGFTMTKMFGSEDGEKFIDASSVKLFLDQVFGIGVKKVHSPIRTHAVDHMLFVMPPAVNSATAMSNMLRQRVGEDYEIINVSGDNNVTSLDTVKRLISRNKKTITVTCGRFNTGVTVPEWDMVMMLDDTRSPETYFQTIFRCQSPDKSRGKELCTVVDFNPQRCLEMIYEFADITAKSGQSTQTAVREFLEFAPVLDHSGNKPVEISVDNVLRMMAENGNYVERFGSSHMFNWEELDNVANKFAHIEAEKKASISDQISDNGLIKGKNYESVDKSSPNLDKDTAKKIREKVITTLRRMPTYLFLEDTKIDNVHDIVYNNNEELFEQSIGLTLDTFKELCGNFIKTEKLDRAIMAFNQIGNLE